ncbi:D-alanyl-D-alanine carboxypeptidase/D-alanyl-D-alanine endopeptidase [Chryseobacterium sp. A301]
MIRVKNLAAAMMLALAQLSFAQMGGMPSHLSQFEENQSGGASLEKEADLWSLSAKDLVNTSIDKLLDDPVLRNANWGFVLYDPSTKKIVSAYNEGEALIPASTTKLLTTDTALALLGPDFKWSTQLEYSGEINSEGVLTGDLYIVGSADPSLGTGKAGALSYGSLINEYIAALSDVGIKKIEGNLILQNAVFKSNQLRSLPANVVWMEHNNYYLPVGSTQNIDPRKEKLTISKKNPFEHQKQYFYISPYQDKLVFADEFDGKPVHTTLPDVPHYLGNTLRTNMIKKGISISGKVIPKPIDKDPENRKLVMTYQSPRLKDIVYDTNQRSDNALAESLLRMVGFQKMGSQTLASGREVVVKHLDEKGFDTSALIYMDGSGLSRNHRVTPISQALFLADEMSEPYYQSFFESLPIAGQTGTLKKMFYGAGHGHIFAKTGTLNKVKTLAGYVKTNSGKTLTFSLLINNYSGSVSQVKAKMEELLDPVVAL